MLHTSRFRFYRILPYHASRCCQHTSRAPSINGSFKTNDSYHDSSSSNHVVNNNQEPGNQEHSLLNFRDPKTAHISKTNFELIRGLFVFNVCSFPLLVKYNKRLIELSRSILGRTLFRGLMRKTFYGQFVAGETEAEIAPVVARLRKYGVKSILDYSVERDIQEDEAKDIVKASLEKVVDEPEVRPAAATKKYQTSLNFADRSDHVTGARTYFYESEHQCDRNMEVFLRCIDSVSSSTVKQGFAAIKVTALGRPQLLLQMSDFLVQMERLFDLLVTDPDRPDSLPFHQRSLDTERFRKRLECLGMQISYDKDVDWFTLMDVSGDGVVDLLDWSHLKSFEYDLATIFAVTNVKTGKTEQLVPTLTSTGLEEMRNLIGRLDCIAKHAKSNGVRVMIDAEQSYFQPAIRRLAMEMMRLFNQDSAVIFNTYQCYLSSALEYIHRDLNHAATQDFYFGAKLVRGAYMEQERARAKALGYKDPICKDFDETSANYNACFEEIIKATRDREIGKVSAMIATHNEDAIRFAIKKMQEYGITTEQRLVCFGQLYGMCDQLSFALGQANYSVYKYLPYGPIEDVLPYLSRRATENGSIIEKLKLEKKLLGSELLRRLTSGDLFYRP